MYNIPTGHSSCCLDFILMKCCEDFKMSQTTSINAFLCPCCFTSASDEVIKPLRVQRYNKKMIYARKGRFFCKNVQMQFGRNGRNRLSGIAARSRQRANVTGIRCRNNAQRTPEYRREQDTNKQPKSRPLIQGWECGRR